jgi:serine/threonine-protein kinase
VDDATRLVTTPPRSDAGAATRPVDDATRLADDGVTAMAPPSRRPATRSPASGWLTTSGSIDHGKFAPGAIIEGRYRVIGLLGKGGMGAVYRADDLRLGQPVALKFLPLELSRDPAQLAQFHNEVRTSRQVSHANVCRVYDVGEVDDHLFLSMEFVDGEDLATSLRRIGRFPEDKALEIARQLCAGVAAAHDRGIVHRDLKPANVMLDGAGRVRVMDFGLATAGGVDNVRAGTPAYMAPEQLAGREVTKRSDVFALGLILYELFTGRRAFAVSSIDDLIAAHERGSVTPPSAIVPSLDPAIDRAIMRCLERDPAHRPASALAVAAALPGGDPLAAALAAGETPSPELVAAAGGERAVIAPSLAAVAIAVIVVGLAVTFPLAGRFLNINQVRFELDPRVLEDRARTFEQSVGAGADAVDRIVGVFASAELQRWVRGLPAETQRTVLQHGWPSPILFWYRSSPRELVPSNWTSPRPGRGDPPLLVSGMTLVGLTPTARLIEFVSVPVQVESRTTPRPPVDWATFFTAAGLEMARFTATTPDWTPRSYADARIAWTGTAAEVPGEFRVEAASHLGVPVNFQVIGPWVRATRMEAPVVSGGAEFIATVATAVIGPGLLLAAAWLARRNVRLARADRHGAAVVAGVVIALQMAQWVIIARHSADPSQEQSRFFGALAMSLFQAAIATLIYLAIEPHVRRVWPQMLITWSRLLSGRVRDAMVGRDLLVGSAAGVLLTTLTYAHYLLPALLGTAAFPPANGDLSAVLGPRFALASMLSSMQFSLQNAFLGALGLVLVRLIVHRTWMTFAIPTALFSFLAARGQFETGIIWLDLLMGAALVTILLGVIIRFGLFAGAVTFATHFITTNMPLTLDTSRPYFAVGAMAAVIVVATAAAGAAMALGSAPRRAAAPLDSARGA